MADILYLKAEPDVGLSRKPFGKNTMVMTLHNESDPISILASLKGVPCVPFRERVFGTYTIKYEGRAALKNFDDAPIKGSFDDIVAKAYGISSKKEDSISLDELNENGQGG